MNVGWLVGVGMKSNVRTAIAELLINIGKGIELLYYERRYYPDYQTYSFSLFELFNLILTSLKIYVKNTRQLELRSMVVFCCCGGP